MNLASTLLALALLGMDDPTSKPSAVPQESAEVKNKVDAPIAPQAVPSAPIGPGVKELEQGKQAARCAA